MLRNGIRQQKLDANSIEFGEEERNKLSPILALMSVYSGYMNVVFYHNYRIYNDRILP